MQLMLHTLKVGMPKVAKTDEELARRWKEFRGKIKIGQEMIRRTDRATVFASIEGTLTRGHQYRCLGFAGRGQHGSTLSFGVTRRRLIHTLYETGYHKSIPRHKDFELFACMNPAMDTGKADLTPGLRFTELHCDEMSDNADITIPVTDYLANQSLKSTRRCRKKFRKNL